jgi:hypothetical protein
MSRGVVRVVLVGVLGSWASGAGAHDTWLDWQSLFTTLTVRVAAAA